MQYFKRCHPFSPLLFTLNYNLSFESLISLRIKGNLVIAGNLVSDHASFIYIFHILDFKEHLICSSPILMHQGFLSYHFYLLYFELYASAVQWFQTRNIRFNWPSLYFLRSLVYILRPGQYFTVN